MTDDILTVDQAASLLDCEPRTVELKIRAGVLPGVKFGRSWVLPRQALLARLNEMAMTPEKEKPTGPKAQPVTLHSYLNGPGRKPRH